MATPADLAPPAAAPRAPSAMRQRLSTFWRWWSGELAQLVPQRLAFWQGVSRVPLVAIEGGEIMVLEPGARSAEQEARVPIATLDLEGRKRVLRGLLERAGETRGRVRLCLARDEALARRVRLPAATEENLSQVLAFEMDRLTPFKAEDVYFDYRVAGRNAASGLIDVDLAMARRDLVDAKVEELRALGASVQGVVQREDLARSGTPPLDLLPADQRGQQESSQERTLRLALALGVALLLVAALIFPVWKKRDAVIALQPLLGKAKQEAEATDAVARELDKQVGDYNFLLLKKHGTYPALAILEEISRLLPDNTWAQQLDVKTVGKIREMQVTGETASSSKLIEIFEQSTMLQNAAPRGTVTRGSVPGTERFMIAAEVKPRLLPEAAPISQTPVAVSPPVAVNPPPASAAAPAPAAGSTPAASPAPTAAVAPPNAPAQPTSATPAGATPSAPVVPLPKGEPKAVDRKPGPTTK